MRTRRWTPLLALLPAALLLSGCEVLAEPGPPPLPTPTTTAVASVFDRERTTVATGTITGAVQGTVRLTGSSRTGFTIDIQAHHVSGVAERDVQLATTLADADCSPTNDGPRAREIDFGVADVTVSPTLRFPPLEATRGDVSYMGVLLLKTADQDTFCEPSRMGVAHLHWTRPAALTGLCAVDSGLALAAAGTTTLRHGRPIAYTVAADDQLADVAGRFGLTPDEVLYLNPRRARGGTRELFVDEVLNLDPAGR